MATRKKRTVAAQPAPPAVVELRCERLGITRPFAPDHAAGLLAWQAERGKTDWQPVTAAASATE